MPSRSNQTRDPFHQKTSGKNLSYWIDSEPGRAFSPLDHNTSCDVVVIGAGIAGITTAYVLAAAGKSVILVDDGNIGSGETGRTTAHLVNAIDDRYYDLEKFFGTEHARLAVESHTAAVDRIEKIVNEENIQCDFKRLDGFLFLHPTDTIDSLQNDLKAAQDIGLHDIQLIKRAPLSSFDTGPCLKYPNQAQFHPMKYLNAIADKIVQLGAKIFTQTHASEFHKDGIETSAGFRISAKHIVVTTNTPVNDRVTMHTKQAPYRTYVAAFRIKRDLIPHLLLWDTGDQNYRPYPYHYVRFQQMDDSNDLLIVGGEDHKTGQADDWNERFNHLEQWTSEHFPEADELLYRWSGQVMEPVDSLAFIGRNPGDENIYICTGDSGNGMTHGTIAGMLISDLILGVNNPWSTVYDPSRKTLKVVEEFIAENANVAKQYTEWVQKGDVDNIEKIERGEGAVIKDGIKPVAVYRDQSGEVIASSAVCVHLGCIVQWNSEEKTFDCPCHGSRFTYDGRVVNGPANRDLERVEVAEPTKK
jgi:glycine/D-amino acid oxidase-like deaminating enzyme/nitrite reductase/ring-hydroxylating ferredoxin subunit